MSTNTADMTNYHPKTPARKIEDYADILHAERPHTKNPMSIANRAAQFSPYAALVGHKDIIKTDESIANEKIDLDREIILENYDEPC